ncbi:MAG: T9SS type A sorting domain-containing protein [Flavobacteriales bacterium]|nr:T9SS type A sorting domain-containing protein [Flavobacteriales bacterium]
MKDFKKIFSVSFIAVLFASYVLINSMNELGFYRSDSLQNFVEEPVDNSFHTNKEKQVLKKLLSNRSVLEPGQYFHNSQLCGTCHGYDPTGNSSHDSQGNDVNLHDDWMSSMMALSAKDPFWRAKVSHEILVNPGISLEIQNKCTSCHAPQGHYTALFNGQTHYTLADLYNDTLGLDGVSCVACHSIGPNGLGNMFTGHIPYDTLFQLYGPFIDPLTGPMQLYTGFTPTYSPHVSEGRFCSPCHTLITQSVDLNGIPTGRSFVEQATYHEWVNSNFSLDYISCQQCHMPRLQDSIIIAKDMSTKRFPFNQHIFMGSNEFMLKLIKNNKADLGVEVPDSNFDSTIEATLVNLQQKTLTMDLIVDSVTFDTAYFSVKLVNLAGHKFPSGYPSRRAILQFAVVTLTGDTLFKSGFFDGNYEVQGINSTFEPHYDIISQPDQVQIYEMVMGDVNGNKTTVLLRADTMLKDNRLVPEGFSTSHPVYDTTRIILGIADDDFNKFNNGNEGSGWDIIQYRVPINGYSQPFNVVSRIYYQAVPPGYLAEMFSHTSNEIDLFKDLYTAADKEPVLMAERTIQGIALSVQNQPQIAPTIWPDPTSDGWINIRWKDIQADEVVVMNANGQIVTIYHIQPGIQTVRIQLPESSGIYLVDVRASGRRSVQKVIRK